jgi:hypothetical protein
VKELKDDLMLPGPIRRALPSSLRSEPSLSDLAEHLSAIADMLRKAAQQTATRDGQVRSARIEYAAPPARMAGAEAGSSHSSQANARLQREVYGDLARRAYAIRRSRAAIFKNAELFGEPAWDILLDLYIAHVDGKPVSVSSACIGSAAPPTTGLRWLGVLSEQDFILREHDPEDQRRILVRLTEKGLRAMDEYFSGAGLTA